MQNWKKTFTIIWSGQFFSMLTSSIVGFAVVFWLSVKTGSAEVLAYAMIATLLPFIAMGIFTGVYVDRWDRRKTMIFADSFVAICSAILGVLFYLDIIAMWQVYLLLALRSAGSAFHMPAMQASVPLLAPESELMRIAGINQIIQSTSNIAGPALGALFMTLFDMAHIMMLDVLGAAIACTSLLFVTIPNPEKKSETPQKILPEIKEGLKHMFANKGLSHILICVIIVTFFLVPISALFPLLTVQHFKGGAYEMGIVEVAWGVGMLVGGAIISMKQMKSANKIILINLMAIIVGIIYAALGMLPSWGFILFVALTAIAGITGSIYWSSFTVLLQTMIDPSALGRVFSIYDSLSLLPTIPGLLATGFIAESIGLLNAFLIAGIAVFAVGAIAFFVPSIRALSKQNIATQEKSEAIN